MTALRAKARSHQADTVSALVDNQRRRLPGEHVPGVKRLTDSRQILLFTTAEVYIRSAKADVRQPNGVHAPPDSNAADCHSVPFAQVPEKTGYDGNGVEGQRAASPQASAVGH